MSWSWNGSGGGDRLGCGGFGWMRFQGYGGNGRFGGLKRLRVGGLGQKGFGGRFGSWLAGAFGELFFEDGLDLGDGGLVGIASLGFNLSDPIRLNGLGGGQIEFLAGQLLVLHL